MLCGSRMTLVPLPDLISKNDWPRQVIWTLPAPSCWAVSVPPTSSDPVTKAMRERVIGVKLLVLSLELRRPGFRRLHPGLYSRSGNDGIQPRVESSEPGADSPVHSILTQKPPHQLVSLLEHAGARRGDHLVIRRL